MTFPGEASVRGPAAQRPRALLFGDRVAPYHPLGAVEPRFRSLFGEDFALGIAESPADLVRLEAGTTLVVGYADAWNYTVSDEEARRLVRYVAAGGGLLLLHNGISWARHPDVLPVVGAVFTSHPEPAHLTYRVTAGHPVATGGADFEMEEEPYRYDFAPGVGAEVFLHYEHEGRRWPAGWALQPGQGRVVVLQPGHRVAAFEHPTYAALVRAAARWCAGVAASH